MLTTSCCRRHRFSHSLFPIRLATRNFQIRSSSSHQSQAEFEDAAFRWARKQPQLARQVLQVPDVADLEVHPLFLKSTATLQHQQQQPQQYSLPNFNLVEYLTWRKWALPQQQLRDDDDVDNTVENDEAATCALRLVSHTLSAPLTLAKSLFGLIHHSKERHQACCSVRCCCVGARAEATLPPTFWKELLVLLHHATIASKGESVTQRHSSSGLNITIDFVGPDVVVRPKDVVVSYQDLTLTLSWNRGAGRLFHQLDDETRSKWDALIFFNPGFGHAHLQEGWGPTLDALFHSDAPSSHQLLLLTAHSPLDVQRDVEVLQDYQDIRATDYTLNPFASGIAYADPFLKGHWVQPNLYTYHNYTAQSNEE